MIWPWTKIKRQQKELDELRKQIVDLRCALMTIHLNLYLYETDSTTSALEFAIARAKKFWESTQ